MKSHAKKEKAYLTAIKTALFDEYGHRKEAIKAFDIEEIATEAGIKWAINGRKGAGKHVIPVPAVEVERDYPHILYETVKVMLKRGRFYSSQKAHEFEKSVVRPEFGNKGKITISEAALTQMVLHCAEEFDQTLAIKKVLVGTGANGYIVAIYLGDQSGFLAEFAEGAKMPVF